MTTLGAVVGVLIALIGSIGGWITVRRTTTASPYEAVVARAVALEKSDAEKAEMILALLQSREDDRRTIRALIDDRDELVRYLGILRDEINAGSVPPAPPLPSHLRDVLRWSWEPDHPTPEPAIPGTDTLIPHSLWPSV